MSDELRSCPTCGYGIRLVNVRDTPATKTLRDEFAMAALTGLEATYSLSPEDAASHAYEYADAMLAQREKADE